MLVFHAMTPLDRNKPVLFTYVGWVDMSINGWMPRARSQVQDWYKKLVRSCALRADRNKLIGHLETDGHLQSFLQMLTFQFGKGHMEDSIGTMRVPLISMLDWHRQHDLVVLRATLMGQRKADEIKRTLEYWYGSEVPRLYEEAYRCGREASLAEIPMPDA